MKQLFVQEKKKQFDYEGSDEPVASGITSFKVNFFYVVLDIAIESLEERFEQLGNHNQNFGFLYDIHNLADCDKKDLRDKSFNLQKILTHENERDIDSQDLNEELLILSPMLPSGSSPADALSYITKNKMMGIFPNTFVSLRILLTLPMSVASGERSFSKLKIIKTYFLLLLSQERLNGLAIISIEKNVLKSLNTARIIKNFATMKARKVHLWRITKTKMYSW